MGVSTPYWLVGPKDSNGVISHFGFIQDCSITESIAADTNVTSTAFSCNGIRTEFQSIRLMVVVALIGLGALSLLILTLLTLMYCFCDQLTACGRSFHTLAGIWQGVASMLTLLGVAVFPILWEEDYILNICRSSTVFRIGDCTPGYSLYLVTVCSFLGYFVAGFSTSLDKKSFQVTEFGSMESLDTYKQGI